MSKITESARGEYCTVRLPGICNGNPDTTVFAHLNGGGMGKKTVLYDSNMKPIDLGCYACSDCHAWLDGEYTKTNNRYERDAEHRRAFIETLEKLISKGLIKT